MSRSFPSPKHGEKIMFKVQVFALIGTDSFPKNKQATYNSDERNLSALLIQ